MAVDNNRAEGRRPPHRGRSDRVKTQAFGATHDQEPIALWEGRSHRETRDLLRQRGRSCLRPLDREPWN